MPHASHEMAVGGRTIRWRETDPGSAAGDHLAALVLLHAFPLSAAMWEPQFDAFPGWRVIAPDVRGFRAPDGPPAEPPGNPTMQELAIDIEHVLDGLGVPQAVIGGASMGGYLALALFRQSPPRFRGLLLANTKASADTDQAKEGRRAMRRLVDNGGAAAVAEDMLPKLLGETTRGEKPELARHVQSLIEANSPEAIKGAIDAMMTRPDSRPLLASIHCPTLVLAGEEDTLIPASAAEELRGGIPDAQLVTLPRCGHLSSLEQPEAFNRALGRFLRNLA